MAEPMILIKKADGTTERVPLSSVTSINNKQQSTSNKQLAINPAKRDPTLRDNKHVTVHNEQEISEPKTLNSEPRTNIPEPISPKLEPVPPKKQTFLTPAPKSVPAQAPRLPKDTDLPMEETPHELSTTTPVSDYFTDLAKAHEWNEQDHKSPLEETVSQADVINPLARAVPSARFEDVAMVTKNISFSIPVDLEHRLHSLIQSRLKDIRSDAQVIEYAARPAEHGGLALTSEQAQELIQAIHTSLETSREESIPAPRRTVQQTPTPKKTATVFSSAPTMSSSSGGGDTSFTDIHPPEKQQQTVGPLEEIGQITMTDFRRYGKDPAKATEILKAKIAVIREESYLEFQKVKVAWIQSPLYGQYLSHITQSLSERTPLTASRSDDMTPEDMKEIALFSASLRM